MAITQLKGKLLRDNSVLRSKLALDFLGGTDWDISNGAVNATITGLKDPIQSSDAATKSYTDAIAGGLKTKAAVRVLSIGNVDITGTTPTTVIDGVTLADGDRVILAGQTTQTENGIYTYASATSVYTRSTDADNTPDGELGGGTSAFVIAGTTYAKTSWTVISPIGVATINTDNIVWSQTNQLGDYTAANGTVLNGNEFSTDSTAIVDTNNGLSVTANQISVNTDGTSGLTFNGGALGIALTAGGGLTATANALGVNVTDVVAANGGVIGDGNNNLIVDPGFGIKVDANGVGVDEGNGLTYAGNLLTAQVVAASGLSVGASGIELLKDTNSGLSSTASGLTVSLQATSGLALGATGLTTNVDEASLTKATTGVIRVAPAGIKQSMIDFGSGVGQVDGTDITLATAGTYYASGANVDTAVAAVDTQVTANTTQIGTNTTAIGTNTTNIGTNTTNIGTNTTNITALQNTAANRNTGIALSFVPTHPDGIGGGIADQATIGAAIVANSEAIYYDGERLLRGASNDYTIDNTTGVITFNASHEMEADDQLVADYVLA